MEVQEAAPQQASGEPKIVTKVSTFCGRNVRCVYFSLGIAAILSIAIPTFTAMGVGIQNPEQSFNATIMAGIYCFFALPCILPLIRDPSQKQDTV